MILLINIMNYYQIITVLIKENKLILLMFIYNYFSKKEKVFQILHFALMKIFVK